MIHVIEAISFFILLIPTSYPAAVLTSEHNLPEFPPEWYQAPSDLNEYAVKIFEGHYVTVVNPWVYQERLGLYKILVSKTRGFFSSWGINNTGNLLWGLPLQFGWQHTSGRLTRMKKNMKKQSIDLCEDIYPYSWWADMNYYLSVIPFLGALKSGIIDPVPYPIMVLKPINVTKEHGNKFCTSITECTARFPELMLRWTKFFHFMMKNVRNFQQTSPTPSPRQDLTLSYLWAGHTRSIETALPLFEEELSQMSKPEQNFGVGWANIVGFIAACFFETNLNNTSKQQKILLPPRVLHKGDNPPYIPDLTKSQNRGLELINIFYETNKFTRGYALSLWQKAMCSPKGRADGRYLMENLIQDPYIMVPSLIKLILDFLLDHRC